MRSSTYKMILYKNFKLIALLATLMAPACGGYRISGIPGTYLPSVNSSLEGSFSMTPGQNFEEAKSAIRNACSDLGGLDENSISQYTPEHVVINLGGSSWFRYKCVGKSTNKNYDRSESNKNKYDSSIVNKTQPSSDYTPSTSTISIEDAKKKCLEIGFKNATEGFGKCVLQLTK